MKAQFPPDQDLAPGDVSITTIIEPRHSANAAKQIVQGVRESYSTSCDLIVMAVPAGKGKAFVQGLQMALKQAGQLG